jgi:predicted  nucleic acid-binding Zn-ribbon protein
MKRFVKYLPLALLCLACDNSVVSRAEYDALLSEKQQLEGLNDSLQFELSSLKIYVERLEEENNELVEELKHTPCNPR